MVVFLLIIELFSVDVVPYYGAFYGQGTGPIFLELVQCAGNERNLTECPHTKEVICSHSQDAGVDCLSQREAVFTIAHFFFLCFIFIHFVSHTLLGLHSLLVQSKSPFLSYSPSPSFHYAPLLSLLSARLLFQSPLCHLCPSYHPPFLLLSYSISISLWLFLSLLLSSILLSFLPMTDYLIPTAVSICQLMLTFLDQTHLLFSSTIFRTM